MRVRAPKGLAFLTWILPGAAAAFVSLACAAAASSSAGVVIDSTSPAYARGDTVSAESTIIVGKGEQVVVLHHSGAVRTFNSPGAHPLEEDAEKRASAARSAMTALMASTQRPEIGATRTFDLDACLELAKTDPNITKDACEMAAAAAKEPQLNVSIAAPLMTFAPDAPVMFQLSSNFDSFLTCRLESEKNGAAETTLKLGPAIHGAAQLDSGVEVHAPKRGGDPITLGAKPGDYFLTCEAFDATAWTSIAFALSESGAEKPCTKDWRRMVAAYGEMTNAPYAVETIKVKIAE